MKSSYLAIILFLTCLGLLSEQDSTYADRLQHLLDHEVADGQFAGGAVGFSVRGEAIVAAAGHRDVGSDKPFERSTLNRIASISKPMTAVAALQLYEQGRLDLDAPISTYLPEYPTRHASRITTRQLLLHSSGIGAYKSNKEKESTREYASLTEAATVFQGRNLVDEPGAAEHYTTYGYVVLGMVIEAVSGQTYEAYMEEHIWRPAGMTDTGVEHLRETYENKSSLYHKTKKGKIRPSETNNLSNRVPGGGIHSTVDDLLKFGRAVIDHRLISEATFKIMTAKPGVPYDGNPYGMGWYIYDTNLFGHTGGQTGCSAFMLVAPEKDVVVVALTNTARAVDHVVGMVVKHVNPMIREMVAGRE